MCTFIKCSNCRDPRGACEPARPGRRPQRIGVAPCVGQDATPIETAAGAAELVVVDARHQPFDDPQGVLEVSVEQHDRSRPSAPGDRMSVSRTTRLMTCASSRASAGQRLPVTFGVAGNRFDDEQRQEVLRTDRPLQFVIEHEVEDFRGQHARVVFGESVLDHHDALSSSASLIL